MVIRIRFKNIKNQNFKIILIKFKSNINVRHSRNRKYDLWWENYSYIVKHKNLKRAWGLNKREIRLSQLWLAWYSNWCIKSIERNSRKWEIRSEISTLGNS
jgi:hypothetical protein